MLVVWAALDADTMFVHAIFSVAAVAAVAVVAAVACVFAVVAVVIADAENVAASAVADISYQQKKQNSRKYR